MVVAHLQYRPGMAADDGGSPAAEAPVGSGWKDTRFIGLQRYLPPVRVEEAQG